jgi:hypothetical protein
MDVFYFATLINSSKKILFMKKQILLLAFACVTLFAACKKNKDSQPPEVIVPPIPVNVYVAGTQWDSITGRDASGVWKNGTFFKNTLAGTNSHYGFALAVSGTDVYTTGYENTPSIWVCHVWKNGVQQYSLGDGYSLGNGIAVSGTDVYVAGYAYDPAPMRYAMQWKNNNAVSILAATPGSTQAFAVTTAGTDVYVGGKENNTGKVWKNGVALTLNNATGCTITSIAVEGADVYAAGYTNSPARVRYWKNGNAVDIATAGTAFGNAITVVNGDVYVAGTDVSGSKAIAKYWKNGTETVLGDGIRNCKANGIAVKGTDVYVTGELQGANSISDFAVVWKNGQVTTIGKANSQAKAIVVK